MLFQLGDIEFESLNAPESMDTTGAANYAEVVLIGGKPRLQRLGDKLDTLTISMRIRREFAVPEDRIAELEAARNAGAILPFVTGAGDVRGDFVITDIATTYTQLAADGSMIEAGVSVTLKEYSTPDRPARERTRARRDAFALAQNSPVQSSGRPTQSVEYDASASVTSTITKVGAVEDSTMTAAAVPAQEVAKRRRASIDLRDALQDAAKARRMINSLDGLLYTNTRDLDGSLVDLINMGTTVIAELGGPSAIADIMPQVQQLVGIAGEIRVNAAFLSKITSSRK